MPHYIADVGTITLNYISNEQGFYVCVSGIDWEACGFSKVENMKLFKRVPFEIAIFWCFFLRFALWRDDEELCLHQKTTGVTVVTKSK